MNNLKDDFCIKVLLTPSGFKIWPENDKPRFIEFCRKNQKRVGTAIFTIGCEDKINKSKENV